VTLIDSLKNCCRCGKEFHPGRTERVCPECMKPRPAKRVLSTRQLTMREMQIIKLVQRGKANKEIAYELHLTEGTIKEYLNRIFRKLEVRNRTELAVWSLTHRTAAA
jgi:DNA-binding NarL/FixJ family response regulator